MELRLIQPQDNEGLKQLIQTSLEQANLAIPGTAYFDPELGRLSDYYQPKNAAYWVVVDHDRVIGGIGIAPLAIANTCELQKLYVCDRYQKQGLANQLMTAALTFAVQHYDRCYLETHHTLQAACRLYERFGFEPIPTPLLDTPHQAMDRFYIKELHSKKRL